MARRDYGTGSITARGADRWQLRWQTPPDPYTGKRVRRAETFRGTKREASARLTLLVNSTNVDTSQVTLGKMIERWRTDTAHELGTQRNYTLAARTIPAKILGTPLADIRAATVRALVTATQARHGVHRARLVHAVVSGALQHAWRLEWLTVNPARKVTPPPPPRRTGTQPSSAEVSPIDFPCSRTTFGYVVIRAGHESDQAKRIRQTQGAEIRKLRKFRRLSIREFAGKVGVTEGAVSQWETGRFAPRQELQVRVAKVLDVPWSTIFGLDTEAVA